MSWHQGGLLLVSFFATDWPEPVCFDHKVTPAYSWPADRFADLLAGAGLVRFARLLHDPASERGFLDAHPGEAPAGRRASPSR